MLFSPRYLGCTEGLAAGLGVRRSNRAAYSSSVMELSAVIRANQRGVSLFALHMMPILSTLRPRVYTLKHKKSPLDSKEPSRA